MFSETDGGSPCLVVVCIHVYYIFLLLLFDQEWSATFLCRDLEARPLWDVPSDHVTSQVPRPVCAEEPVGHAESHGVETHGPGDEEKELLEEEEAEEECLGGKGARVLRIGGSRVMGLRDLEQVFSQDLRYGSCRSRTISYKSS